MIHRARPDSPFVALLPLERGGFIAGLIVIVVMSGMFALISDRGANPALYGAFVVYVVVLSLPLFSGFLRTPGLFHPLFFYATWSGLRSLLTGKAVLGASGLEFHRALPGMRQSSLELVAAQSFLLDALALISLYVGFGLIRNIHARRLLQPRQPRQLALSAVLWMALPTTAVAILMAEAGGFGSLMLERGIASDQRLGAAIGGHWHFLAGTGTIAPVVWLAFERRAARHPIFWLVALFAAFLVFSATGSRSSAVTPLILIALMWSLRHRTIPYRALWIAAAVAILLVGLLGEFRAATRGAESLVEVEFQADTWSSAQAGYDELVQRSTANNGQIAVLGSVPEHVDYLWGESYLSIPFVFIPSALWAGETPDAAGKLNATYIYGNPLTGIPTGTVGEAYWNFSYAGIITVFLIFGIMLRCAASLYRANSEHPLIITMYLYTITTFAPGSNQIYNFIHALVPVVAFYLFVRLMDRVRLKRPSAARVPGLSTKG